MLIKYVNQLGVGKILQNFNGLACAFGLTFVLCLAIEGQRAWGVSFSEAKEVAGDELLEGQKILERLVLSGSGKDLPLESLGKAIRHKPLFLVNVKVYVAQLFGADPKSFAGTNSESALNSLVFSPAMAMRMTFLRTVSGARIEESFRKACEANGIDPSEGSFSRFLAIVKAGLYVKKGDSILVWGLKENGKDVVFYRVGGKTERVEGESGFLRQVFSLWLGKPVDSGMEKLQKEILGEK